MDRHIFIESIQPSLDNGRFPAKRIAGEPCVVEATVFRDGHEMIRANLKWKPKQEKRFSLVPMKLVNSGLDTWQAEFTPDQPGRFIFTVEAWTDRYATWLEDLKKRVEGGYESVKSEVLEGIELIEEAAFKMKGNTKREVEGLLLELQGAMGEPKRALALASSQDLLEQMDQFQPRLDRVAHTPGLEVMVNRRIARFSAWYEIFIRSQGRVPGKSGTFEDAERRLPEIKKMGFNVVYLAPIHPIGKTKRKGRNNSLQAGPNDPGSPWAIGSEDGGHKAIEPSLGTFRDFDRFVKKARELEMEVALDFAIQASPDHPWVKEHPEWFYHRPDGSIKYAENPPKKYEDIYPVNFDTSDRDGLWDELYRTILFWVEHGVKIFRVDNPHTKPFHFWEWLIGKVQEEHPDTIFLSEAFTRPPKMNALAKLGFTQSYTYFTWRNTKQELTEYLTELTQSGSQDYFMPNFFANTPDILTEYLQTGGRPAFKIRLVLAATLSPSYGVYSGFELIENQPIRSGSEEYLDSEKYEIKVRDWNKPGNIVDFIIRLNAIRRENPALQEFTNLRFFPTNNEQILFYGKMTADRSNIVLVAVNLDPHHPHHCTASVPLEEIGLKSGESFEVQDLISGERYKWSNENYIRLDPAKESMHILRVERGKK